MVGEIGTSVDHNDKNKNDLNNISSLTKQIDFTKYKHNYIILTWDKVET